MVLLCGLVVPKLAAQSTSPEEQAGSLRGTVVNSVTHEPIGHALVVSSDNRFATMTDDQGHFEFVLPRPDSRQPEVLQPGALQYGRGLDEPSSGSSANRPSQLTARRQGFLNDDEHGQSNVLVTAEQKEVTLSLTPEALVVGQIVLPDESDRIVVELYRSEIQEGRARWISVGTTVAKSDGEFRFASLKTGKYKLLTQESLDRDPLTFDPRGQLYGYPPVYFPAAKDFTSAATFEVSAGSTFQASLTPVRQAYYRVRIPVANMSPGAGMRIIVSSQGRPGPGFNLGYNMQEQRIEGMLPDGVYGIEVMCYGSPVLSGAMNITVKGAALQAPSMNLVPGGSIAVNVKEEFTTTTKTGNTTWNSNGRSFQVKGPRSYLNVTLWPADDFGLENMAAPGPPSGPDDDSILIPDVQPGHYWVQVNSSRGFPAAITSGGADLLHHPLVVGWGGSVSPIEITMRDDWAQLSGKIEHPNAVLPGGLSSAGDGPDAIIHAANAWVCLVPLPDSTGQFQQIWISPNGESGDIDIAPGQYRVLAFDHQQPELEYRNPEAMRAYDGKGQEVRLVAGQKEQITLPLISTEESQ
jgi:hypothetical protein